MLELRNDPVPDAVISAFPPDCRPTRSLRWRSGGFSDSRIWRCQTPRGELALRGWPEEFDSGRLAWIHRLQVFLAREGAVPIAAPIAALSGETFVLHANRAWELAPWLPGEPLLSTAPTPRLIRTALAAIASLHQTAVRFDGSPQQGIAPAVMRRRLDLKAVAASDHEAWSQALAERGWENLSALATAWKLLAADALPVVERQLAEASSWIVPLQPCVRDLWSDHVLFVGDRVSGILDFGAAGEDTVATDLARFLASLGEGRMADCEEGLAAYEQIRPLSETERRLISVVDRAAMLLGPTQWFRWIAEEDRDFLDRQGVTDRVSRMVALLAAAEW